MADADSVSEATSKDLLLPKLGWPSSTAHRVADKSDEDTVATNSINPFSTSESSSLSSSPVTGHSDDSLALRVSPFGLCNYGVVPNQELTNHKTPGETMPLETEAAVATAAAADEEEAESGVLDASLRNAEIQASLEAFKARHSTLPLVKTDAWCQDLCTLTPSLLQRYYDELMAETGRVSEQLVASLAEREELILFREVEDDFVVLHNAIQVRRRRAAEAVLARTTQSVLFHKKTTHLTTVRQLPADPRTGSLIELVSLPPDLVANGIGSSADSMLRPQTVRAPGECRNISSSNVRTSSRCPRGHPVGEPINLPSLRSALSRLGSRLGYRSVSTSHLTADRNVRGQNYQQYYEAGSAAVGFDNSETMQLIQAVKSRKSAGGRKHAVTLPSPYLPWPLGRPECSQVLRLAFHVPAEELNTWLPPRLHIINRILQAALQESQTTSSLLEELSTYDPAMAPEPTSKLVDYGFEASDARLTASLMTFSRPEKTHSRKNVTFDWRGTKEPFNVAVANSKTLISATQSDKAI
uniref:Uncharacterized protein n=2 Tax=Schistocephalus solidus TaxID=70667 RepID=A0A0X3PY09_SCHSO